MSSCMTLCEIKHHGLVLIYRLTNSTRGNSLVPSQEVTIPNFKILNQVVHEGRFWLFGTILTMSQLLWTQLLLQSTWEQISSSPNDGIVSQAIAALTASHSWILGWPLCPHRLLVTSSLLSHHQSSWCAKVGIYRMCWHGSHRHHPTLSPPEITARKRTVSPPLTSANFFWRSKVGQVTSAFTLSFHFQNIA